MEVPQPTVLSTVAPSASPRTAREWVESPVLPRLKAITDVTPGVSTPNRTFGYDPDRYFLTSSTGPYAAGFASQTMSWTYDKNSNRLTEARSGIGTTTYGYENDGSGHSNGVINAITPPGGGAITVTHSSAGDLTLDEEAVQYSYDALGRVTEGFSVSGCSPSARNVLGRDALGHRVSRSVYPCNSGTVSKTEYFVYGADGSLYFREGYNGSGGLIEREAYAFLEDEPVAILRSFDAPTGNFFLHNDHLGRPLAMSGTDGFLKWKGEFEPFGKSLTPRVKTSGIEPGFRFPGQWEYGDSGDVQGERPASWGASTPWRTTGTAAMPRDGAGIRRSIRWTRQAE